MNNFEYFIHRLEQEKILSKEVNPQILIRCLDLTSLNASDDEKAIHALCQKALKHQVAAVCIYPAFVSQAAERLKNSFVKVATVANFPEGVQPLSMVCASIEQALKEGAKEVDVVIPYQAFLESQEVAVLKSFVQTCKALLPKEKLKIIMESGAFHDVNLLEKAALACLEGGADFLKTSTGKISQGATLMSAAVLIQAIQRFGEARRGFKASGGVRHYDQAKMYYLLSEMMMGESWPSPTTFRIGASSLLDELEGY